MIERKFVKEGLNRSKLDEYLGKKLSKAGYVGCEVQKTPITTRIVIRVERPGLVIGRHGSTIKMLTDAIETKFGMENVQIKVDEISVPELNAAIMAKRIALSLEKGINFRRLLHWSIEKIMGAGAIGAEIIVAGKIQGKGAKGKKERVSAGYLQKAGDGTKLVDNGHAQAIKKAGIIGVTVRIVPPTVRFADKVDVRTAKLGGEKSVNTESEGNTSPTQSGEGQATPAAA